MAETKTAATPKRTTTRKKNTDRPKRPEFVVIEDSLHYSPDGVSEVVVSIDPEWGLVEPVIQGASDDTSQAQVFVSIMELLYGEAGAREKIRGLKTSQFFKLAYRWMEEFQAQMGVDNLGE